MQFPVPTLSLLIIVSISQVIFLLRPAVCIYLSSSDSFREPVFNTGRISISRDFRWQALKLKVTPNASLHVTYICKRFKKVWLARAPGPRPVPPSSLPTREGERTSRVRARRRQLVSFVASAIYILLRAPEGSHDSTY